MGTMAEIMGTMSGFTGMMEGIMGTKAGIMGTMAKFVGMMVVIIGTMAGIMGTIVGIMGTMAEQAPEGKRIVRGGEEGLVLVTGEGMTDDDGLDATAEWDEEVMGGTVIVVDDTKTEVSAREPRESSKDRWGSRSGFEFLENVEVEERNDELNEKVREGRKRKINQDEEGLAKKKRVLDGLPG
jgi:hypothetical protein